MEEKILSLALENLKKHTGIIGIYKNTNKMDLDGEIEMMFQKGKEKFKVEVKREIRSNQLSTILDKAKENKNLLLIAETIYPNIKEELRKQGIGYLDIAGNIYLQTDKHNLWIEGLKRVKLKIEKPNRAFKSAGIKLIFHILTCKDILNQPQRTISENTGVSLGNISYILNELEELNFLIKKNKNAVHLNNKKELLQKWMTGFDEILKPSLHIGNFRFIKKDEEQNWKKLNLRKNQTYWSGEPAGELITNYLHPEIFTIYTDESSSSIIKNYRFVPDQMGNIKIFKKFWKGSAEYDQTVVHAILAYSDLLNSGNSRCIETANKIYEEHIKENI